MIYLVASVSISANGQRVAVGAKNNNGNGPNSGHVRIYEYDGVNWTQLGVDIDGEDAFDQSGGEVALSADGGRVAIGAIENRGNGISSGHVRIYEYDGSEWIQLGVDIDGKNQGSKTGVSVSLSANGSRVAIGARFVRNEAGDLLGNVQVYEYDGASWNELGNGIDGANSSDFFGESISLSENGNRLAIGIIGEDSNGSNAGQTKVYEYDGAVWTQLGSNINGSTEGDLLGKAVSLSSDG